MRHQPLRCAIRPDLFTRPAECERLGPREYVGQRQVVVITKRVELGPLMDELIEGVLAIGARLAPVDRSGLIPGGTLVLELVRGGCWMVMWISTGSFESGVLRLDLV